MKTFSYAINGRQLIRFQIEGELKFRDFQPYVLYRSLNENVLVAGWQVIDPSRKEWRIISLDVINSVTLAVLLDTFEPDAGFSSLRKYGDRVICAVDRPKDIHIADPLHE